MSNNSIERDYVFVIIPKVSPVIALFCTELYILQCSSLCTKAALKLAKGSLLLICLQAHRRCSRALQSGDSDIRAAAMASLWLKNFHFLKRMIMKMTMQLARNKMQPDATSP